MQGGTAGVGQDGDCGVAVLDGGGRWNRAVEAGHDNRRDDGMIDGLGIGIFIGSVMTNVIWVIALVWVVKV